MTTAKHATFAAAPLDLLAARQRWVGSIRRTANAPTHAARTVAPETRRLDQRTTETISAPAGRELKCEYGTVWLTDTVDGAPTDVILHAGNSHRCLSRSAVLVYAITAAELRIC